MSWLRTGTVTVTNGNPNVTAVGVDFIANYVKAGDAFRGPDNSSIEIGAVTSATTLVLVGNYQGATAAGQAYAIQPTSSLGNATIIGLLDIYNGLVAVRDGVGQGLIPDGTVGAPAIRFSADQDTGFYRPGANQFGIATGGLLRLVVNADGTINVPIGFAGNIGFGTATPDVYAGGTNLHVKGASLALATFESGNCKGQASVTANFGMVIGTLTAQPLIFYVNNIEGARFDISGNFAPGVDNVRTLGSASLRWSTIYGATGAVSTSDERSKQQIAGMPDEWLDAWGDVEWVRFKFNDAVDAKGDQARWHLGLIAQRVHAAFSDRGLDAETIGLLCFDDWDATPGVPAVAEERNEEGEIVIRARAAVPPRAAGDRWGLRYDECLAIEAAWQRREIAQLCARLDAMTAASSG